MHVVLGAVALILFFHNNMKWHSWSTFAKQQRKQKYTMCQYVINYSSYSNKTSPVSRCTTNTQLSQSDRMTL